MNISLSSELEQYLEAKVATGRYKSSSEVVTDALRLMAFIEHDEADDLAVLRQAWQEGLDSGEAEIVDFNELRTKARARLALLDM